ncbi:zinc knuckle [Ancylostoma duodenale]|uniref:Zinc knuckle n=1 Tax=Ancylostoma duodenale TaxID=51022 RepID=A0A0C2H7L6_9BILA|nr:zinc knuckle [Ancylostoma duodenale]
MYERLKEAALRAERRHISLRNRSTLHGNKTRYHDKSGKDDFRPKRHDNEGDAMKAEESTSAVSELQDEKAVKSRAAKLRCFNCNGVGHKARECGKAQREGNHSGQAMSLSTRIQRISCRAVTPSVSGLQAAETRRTPVIGERTIVKIEVLGRVREALLDTGSEISILPVSVLQEALAEGIDIDSEVRE